MLKIMEYTENGDLREMDTDTTIKNAREGKKLLEKIGRNGQQYAIVKIHAQIKVQEKREMVVEELDFNGMAKA